MTARGHVRVLVVDDRAEMAEMVAEMLIERGFEAISIVSGREAVALLGRERFDAVVTDLRMPDVDGLGVLEASKTLDPTRPVIVMTAHAALESALEAVRRGANHYLMKPFRVDVLAEMLARSLSATNSTARER